MADDRGFPTGAEIIDQNRHGLIGRPVDRVDGWAKVTGSGRYAYEVQEAGSAAYGFLVTADAAPARLASIDVAAAQSAPGVLLVWTHQTAPRQAASGMAKHEGDHLIAATPYLNDDQTRFFGDPVALVVAESFEQARAAAALIKVEYELSAGAFRLEDHLDRARIPEPADDSRIGDFEAAFASASVQLDETYTTPAQSHGQMEPHASLATWDGDSLILYTSTQLLKSAQSSIAATLTIPEHKVRVISRYIGGGFGGKLEVYADAILAALASRVLNRPVKVALTRQQMFCVTCHRTPSRQRVRLGASAEGRLVAIGHEGITHTADSYEFTEAVAAVTRTLYAAPNRLTSHRVATLDVPPVFAMRAPGEAIGMLAIECAMDEMAERLGLDPIELRVRNEPETDPETGKPFSSRSLVACMRDGAQRFGWARRRAEAGVVGDGRWLVGMGMSASIRANYLVGAKAGLKLNVDGSATVRQAMTDIGTGTYTILAQLAAETLGLPVQAIHVEIGDSSFPPAPGSGGSFGAASAGSALLDAAMALRRTLADLAVADPESPLHRAAAEQAEFTDGLILIGNRAERLVDLLVRSAPEGLEASGACTPSKSYKDYSQHAHGAHFAEVGVDRLTGEVRLRRMLGVFAAGRILNAKTARSQAIGGMIWGVGAALTEENPIDSRYGSFANQDLGNYHVPSHADIVDLDAVFIAEADDHGNPMKIKGVGELGICGAGAAVANAVYNACGVRVRDYPLTLDKVLSKLGDSPAV